MARKRKQGGEPGTRARRVSPWSAEARAPRPFDRWLYEMFHSPRWRDGRPQIPWLLRARQLAREHGCRLVYDRTRPWQESVCLPDFEGKGPAVLVGGVGEEIDACSAFLHELAHHVLIQRHQHSGLALPRETAAWDLAQQLAAEHKLPLNPQVRRTALYSYRRGQLLAATAGSRARTRRRPAPHSWQLEESRRSADISTGNGLFCEGKKGKRHAKRFVKRAAARAERRKGAREGQDE